MLIERKLKKVCKWTMIKALEGVDLKNLLRPINKAKLLKIQYFQMLISNIIRKVVKELILQPYSERTQDQP